MRDDSIDWTRLERYLAGEGSPAERRAVEAWMAQGADEKALAGLLEGITTASQAVPQSARDSQRVWQDLTVRMDRPQRVASTSQRGARYGLWGVLAASALVVAVSVDASYRYLQHTTTQAFREFATPAGGRAEVTLRDGTRLVLGPASRVRVPEDFGRSVREVTLEGEGYFAVVHDTRHPFAVLTRNLQINDVGTEFDVRAYDDEIRVSVAKGSVVVGAAQGPGAQRPGTARPLSPNPETRGDMQTPRPSSPQNTPTGLQEIPLSAGDIAEFGHGAPTITHHADIASATAWLQGGLAFRDAPFAQAVQEVARRFDLKITVTDSALNTQQVTATFGNESADDVLDEITHAVGARYERTGQQVVVRRRTGAAWRNGDQVRPEALRTARVDRN